MGSYKITWKTSAQKELRNLKKATILKILNAIEELAGNPFPHAGRKLRGSVHTYRIQVGDYRVVYNVSPSVLTIEIIRVRHRKDIYLAKKAGNRVTPFDLKP